MGDLRRIRQYITPEVAVLAANALVSRKYPQVTPILKQLHWLPVKYRCMFKTATLVYKFLHSGSPSYFQPFFSLSSCSYSTRRSHPDHQYLTVPPFHSSVFKSNILITALPLMLLRSGMNFLMMSTVQHQLPPSERLYQCQTHTMVYLYTIVYLYQTHTMLYLYQTHTMVYIYQTHTILYLYQSHTMLYLYQTHTMVYLYTIVYLYQTHTMLYLYQTHTMVYIYQTHTMLYLYQSHTMFYLYQTHTIMYICLKLSFP